MIKLRVQGTKKNIRRFYEVLQHTPEIELIQVSKIYTNKGTDQYFRWYADIQIVELKEDK